MVRFTSATYLGAMADYTSYQTTTSVTAGSHRRALALLQWNVVRDRLPSWFHPFGQIGFGGGEMEYVGFTRVERLRGLAARVAAGAQFCVHPRLDLAAVVSFDRLDVAPDQMGRFYPTMLSVNLEIALHWPNGEPLIRSAMIR